MEYGIVYLLTNPVMPGLVKIGMTTQEDIDKRMKELYTTGVPVPFECKFACKVKKSDCLKIEKALHKAFDPQRINQNREFFRINVEQAQAILELFHHEDVTEEVTDEIQNDLTDEDKAASTKAQAKRLHHSTSMRWGCRKAIFSYGKMTHQFLLPFFQSVKCVMKEKKLLLVRFLLS